MTRDRLSLGAAEIRGAVSELAFVLQGVAHERDEPLRITKGSVFSVRDMWFSLEVNGKKRKDVKAVWCRHSAGEVIFQLSGACVKPPQTACVHGFFFYGLHCVHIWLGLNTRQTHILALVYVWSVSEGVCVGSLTLYTIVSGACGTDLVFPFERLQWVDFWL